MPASAMTTLLPRPRSVCGSSRLRAKRMSARSSWTLWTVAKRSAGPPTRIVVNRASGSSRTVLTPIRRWMAVPIAIGSKPLSVAAVIGAPRATAARSRRHRAAAGARLRPGPARRPPRRLRAGRRAGQRRPSGRGRRRPRAGRRPRRGRRRRSASSRISRAPPASARTLAFAVWWPAACGYGTMTEGIPRAVTSASVDEPARPTTRSAATSAGSMSSRRNGNGRYRDRCVGRQSLPGGERGRVAVVAGHVQDVAALDEPRQRLGDGRVEALDRLGAAEDQHDPGVRRELEPGPGSGSVDGVHVPDRRPRQEPRRYPAAPAPGRSPRATPRSHRPAGRSAGQPGPG